jgi:hypothetical protein
MSGNPCLILEWSESHEWAGLFTGVAGGGVRQPEPLRIPQERRPVMLQPDRKTAEEEAKRLAMAHPGKRFAIFEAQVESRRVEIASHVTVKGEVWMTRPAAALCEIDDGQIPF